MSGEKWAAQGGTVAFCDKLQQTVKVSDSDGDILLEWDACPRCGHAGRQLQPRSGWVVELDVADAQEAAVEHIVVHCSCGEDHEGRPQDDPHRGCGLSCNLWLEV